MRRVLVTGGAGFIGSHLCERLVARGVEVVVVDNLSSGSVQNLSAISERVEVIVDDVRNLAAHQRALRGVDTIFHLAALISGHDSLLEPERYWDENMRGVLEVVRLARENHSRVVFASSSTVYGGHSNGEPLSEATLPAPITAYAATKLAGEHTLEMYSRMWGFSAVSLRLFNVYGPRQNPHHPYANVTCKFSRAAALGEGVSLYGDGRQTRDFIFVDDVVAAFLGVATASRWSLYNVGTGRETSIESLLGLLEEIVGRSIDVDRKDPWPNDIRSIRAEASRFVSEFGSSEFVDIRHGLRRTVDFFRGG